MSETKLLPCPFCGGEAVLEPYEPGVGGGSVYCLQCECSTPDFEWNQSLAVEVWNRRTTKESPPPPKK